MQKKGSCSLWTKNDYVSELSFSTSRSAKDHPTPATITSQDAVLIMSFASSPSWPYSSLSSHYGSLSGPFTWVTFWVTLRTADITEPSFSHYQRRWFQDWYRML